MKRLPQLARLRVGDHGFIVAHDREGWRHLHRLMRLAERGHRAAIEEAGPGHALDVGSIGAFLFVGESPMSILDGLTRYRWSSVDRARHFYGLQQARGRRIGMERLHTLACEGVPFLVAVERVRSEALAEGPESRPVYFFACELLAQHDQESGP